MNEPTLGNMIKRFTELIIRDHPQTAPWLENWSIGEETQILPASSLYTDDDGATYETNPVRIPFAANTNNANWKDRPVDAPLYRNWRYFGSSGWNWQNKRSVWVGYDFDSVANHAGPNAQEPEELEAIKERLLGVPGLTLRTSKSGLGLHLMVYFAQQPMTRNHDEHAALAGDVLKEISKRIKKNLEQPTDCFGRILWHYERGMSNDGCKLIN